jgi:hypothetical protein
MCPLIWVAAMGGVVIQMCTMALSTQDFLGCEKRETNKFCINSKQLVQDR